ncbi:MAG TPA: VOC family protein [Dyadobacter sp.]|jgi:catechol-2,3-dioxygenase|nr:VOC family protein [Dyadobacter sp.]
MKLNGILESALYFDDIEVAAGFYKDLFGLETLVQNERLIALNIAGKQVLLLFKKDSSTQPITLPGGGIIPPHDGSGPVHLAFSIDSDSYDDWLARLSGQNIEIESTVDFNEGRSIYFRDPGDHLVELATPGIWKGLE